jgi:hypothetical protein
MKDISTVDYNPTSEKLVNILCRKTQNNNPQFFRILTAYYFAKLTSMMRVNIDTRDRGLIPINIYAINLASSGQGKGHSTNIVEEQVINQFRENFLTNVFPAISEVNLAKLAVQRAAKKTTDPDDELKRVEAEFHLLGNLAFSFDSGTPAAIKQMRHKLLMANAGSMNLEIDEIGSNLLGNKDILNVFLELYDVGKVKPKLIKNTADNIRSEEIEGRTPTNMMLYGTPSKLLDGGKIEEELISFFDTGYARRCIFGYSKTSTKDTALSPSAIYDMLTNNTSEIDLSNLSDEFGILADVVNFGKTIYVSKDVTLLMIEYQLHCERIANAMPEHKEILKAEITHRYFKSLKLAGVYAFIEGSSDLTEDHLYSAIKLVEASGDALADILTRDKNYVKLAKYIASVGREVTHVDLVEELPFYKGATSVKADLLTLAITYGYKNNIIIKKQFTNGIEFLKGETIEETNLDEICVAYSTQLADNYDGEFVPFDKLDQLTNNAGYHWTNHHFINNYRLQTNVIAGFNMVVLDVDEGISISTAQLLLRDYTYLMYETKRSTPTANRFRILLPISHKLKLDSNEYKEYMENLTEWLPFKIDESANQRERKWMSNNAPHYKNDGKLLDALLFIPNTTKNEERKQVITDLQSLSNMERWFVSNTGKGNRSNQLIKYALMLVDSGQDIDSVRNNVLALNNKLVDRMDEAEVLSTIMISAAKAIAKATK